MLVMFLFFAAKSPSSLGRSPRNFATMFVCISLRCVFHYMWISLRFKRLFSTVHRVENLISYIARNRPTGVNILLRKLHVLSIRTLDDVFELF